MTTPPLAQYSVPERRKRAVELSDKSLDISNQIWHAILRLIVTLSSSGLILTVALADKLFPGLGSLEKLSGFLIIGWILFFISIIFGIVAGVNESLFFGDRANKHIEVINECDEKMSQGIIVDTISMDEQREAIISSTVFWGTVSIDSFILAIIFICVAFLERVVPNAKWYILIISLIFVLGLNLYLLNKRRKLNRPEGSVND
jgi:hypothetical protein